MKEQNYRVQQLSKKELLNIYRTIAPAHFPEDELKPVFSVKSLLRRKAYMGLGIFDETDTLLGYGLFLTVPGMDTVLLDYYAILEPYRSLGIGSIFLQEMKDFFADYRGIFIETEDPDSAQNEEDRTIRNRRNDFYYRNGVRPTEMACSLFGVPLNILFFETAAGTDTGISPKPETVKSEAPMWEAVKPETPVSEADSLRSALEALYRFMFPFGIYARHVEWL